MPLRKSFALVAAVIGVVGACAGGNDATVQDGDARYSFSLRDKSRACKSSDDCMLANDVSNCLTCGCPSAVSRNPGYLAVLDACAKPGAPVGGGCGLGCLETNAVCFEGSCVVQSARADGPRPTCGGGDAGAKGGAPSLRDPGASTACGVRGIRSDFENGLDPSWTATNASAVSIDRAEPINGGASLRIRHAQDNAYLTIAQPDACALRIAFTLRTRVSGNLTLARIVVGETSWIHLQLGACSMTIAEELRSATAAGIGFGGAIATIPDDVAVRVVLTVDLRAKTISTFVARLGEPYPAPTTMTLRSGDGAIKAIELGSAPGITPSAVGHVWIDDLVID